MAAMRRALLPLLLAVAPGCDDPGTAGPATIHGGDAAADARVATPDRGVEDAEVLGEEVRRPFGIGHRQVAPFRESRPSQATEALSRGKVKPAY